MAELAGWPASDHDTPEERILYGSLEDLIGEGSEERGGSGEGVVGEEDFDGLVDSGRASLLLLVLLSAGLFLLALNSLLTLCLFYKFGLANRRSCIFCGEPKKKAPDTILKKSFPKLTVADKEKPCKSSKKNETKLKESRAVSQSDGQLESLVSSSDPRKTSSDDPNQFPTRLFPVKVFDDYSLGRIQRTERRRSRSIPGEERSRTKYRRPPSILLPSQSELLGYNSEYSRRFESGENRDIYSMKELNKLESFDYRITDRNMMVSRSLVEVEGKSWSGITEEDKLWREALAHMECFGKAKRGLRAAEEALRVAREQVPPPYTPCEKLCHRNSEPFQNYLRKLRERRGGTPTLTRLLRRRADQSRPGDLDKINDLND